MRRGIQSSSQRASWALARAPSAPARAPCGRRSCGDRRRPGHTGFRRARRRRGANMPQQFGNSPNTSVHRRTSGRARLGADRGGRLVGTPLLLEQPAAAGARVRGRAPSLGRCRRVKAAFLPAGARGSPVWRSDAAGNNCTAGEEVVDPDGNDCKQDEQVLVTPHRAARFGPLRFGCTRGRNLAGAEVPVEPARNGQVLFRGRSSRMRSRRSQNKC